MRNNANKHNPRTYVIIVAVAIVAFFATYWLADNSILSGFLASPGVAALFFVLWQLTNDEISFQRELRKQDNEFQFTLGAMSHMANETFDNYVAFSKEYIAKVRQVVKVLYQKGVDEEAMNHARELADIRLAHEIWIPVEVANELAAFEQKLRMIGANAKVSKDVEDNSRFDEQRAEWTNEALDILVEIVGGSKKDKGEEQGARAIVALLVKILDIENLHQMRTTIVTKAMARMKP